MSDRLPPVNNVPQGWTAPTFPPGDNPVMPLAYQPHSGSLTPLRVDEFGRLQVTATASGAGGAVTITGGTSGGQPVVIAGTVGVVGIGTAGQPAGGIVTVQGLTSGSPVAVQPSGYQGALSNISIANLGSASPSANIAANAARRYLMIHNPSQSFNIYVNPTNLSALPGAIGTLVVTPNGSLTYENNFIPVNAMSVAGQSGLSATIVQG